MNLREFNMPHLNLKYFIGISQATVNLGKLFPKNEMKTDKQALDLLFHKIEDIQSSFSGCTIQVFSPEYILDLTHIHNACYFMEMAFLNNLNISNKKNIELLLYLAANRQIKVSMEAYGTNLDDLEKGKLTYCIISNENNLHDINERMLQGLIATEVDMRINHKSLDKYHKIKQFFEIADPQIKVVLNSYGIKLNLTNLTNNDLDVLYIALNDLLCEKMTLLSLEKTTTNS